MVSFTVIFPLFISDLWPQVMFEVELNGELANRIHTVMYS